MTAFKTLEHRLTDSAFISDIPSQMHPSPTIKSVVSYFKFCYLYFQQEVKFWLIYSSYKGYNLCFEDV